MAPYSLENTALLNLYLYLLCLNTIKFTVTKLTKVTQPPIKICSGLFIFTVKKNS